MRWCARESYWQLAAKTPQREAFDCDAGEKDVAEMVNDPKCEQLCPHT